MHRESETERVRQSHSMVWVFQAFQIRQQCSQLQRSADPEGGEAGEAGEEQTRSPGEEALDDQLERERELLLTISKH